MNQTVPDNKEKWYHRLSPNRHLDSRLLLWFFTVSLVPLVLIGIVGSTLSTKTGNKSAIKTVNHSFEQQLLLLNNYFRSLKNHASYQAEDAHQSELIRAISRIAVKNDLNDPAFYRSVQYGQAINPYVSSYENLKSFQRVHDFLLIDLQGNVIYSLMGEDDLGKNLLENNPENLHDRHLLTESLKRTIDGKDVTISEFGYYRPSGKGTYFFILAPVRKDSAGITGYTALQYSTDSLEQILSLSNTLGPTARSFLFNREKKIIVGSRTVNPDTSGHLLGGNAKIDTWIQNQITGRQPSGFKAEEVSLYESAPGIEVLGMIKPVGELMGDGPAYFLLQEIGPSDAFGYSEIINFIMIGMLITIFFLVSITAIMVTRRIIKPINQMSDWARQVSLGNLKYQAIKKRKDEIGRMTKSFTEVVNSFREVADVTEAMALGDFSKNVRVKSDADTLAISTNQMLASFNNVIDQAQRISMGDYNTEILPRSDKDVLGQALYNMTRDLRENSAEILKQDWLKTGMTSLSLLMSGDKPINELTREVISYLVKYLDGQVGLFYIFDQDDTLTLLSTYAFTDRKGNFSKLKIGEGLVGQAALEQEIILFSDIKTDAPELNYGVNEKIPAYFVIAPLVFGKQLAGVLQIGSVNEFPKHHLEFLKQAVEPVAIALNTAQSRVRVKVLLTQTQSQAEQLQMQQEELRQTNEELEEQTHALKSSEEALQSQQEELRVINEELQERTKALEMQRDDIRQKNQALEVASREIEKKALDLEQASRYKSEFLANMSHELRTPLNSILVLSQLLAENRKNNLTPKQIEFASTIHSSGSDLLELISEILDLSKIEAGKIELHPEMLKIKEFTNQIETLFKPVADKKRLDLIVNIAPGTPDAILVDSQRLHQIIRNLMSNALKFTEKGSVTLSVTNPPPSAIAGISHIGKGEAIMLSVIDTGIGIANDKLEVIFEAFHQADGTTSRKFGGTGLGLTISRSFAALLGGEIQIKSKPGEGSKFTLIIPVIYSRETADRHDRIQPAAPTARGDHRQDEPRPPQATELVHQHNHFIEDDRDVIQKGEKILLVIEDDLAFAGILRDMAREKGFRCLVAPDGESGLHFADFYAPSAIILDIGLPGIDGWQVMDRLKQNPATRHIPVHFISATDRSADALKMGAIGYLTKPVSIEKVMESFSRIEEVISKPVKRLLVAEDDPVIARGIIELLGGNDVVTTSVINGEDAYRLLETEPFDCMILDLNLADMTGFELIGKIRANKHIGYVPIIVYTGQELTKAEEEQLKQYADSIIIKGLRSPERLLAESTLFLHRVATNLPREKQDMLKMLYNREDVFHDKTVMLVDDDSRNLFALSSVLEEKGLTVITAGNGMECLERLRSSPKVDVILMDVMMPEMDGFEAIVHVRAMEAYSKTPIIALTAKAMKEDREKCIDAGANDYLSKPVDSQKLLSLLRVWLYR